MSVHKRQERNEQLLVLSILPWIQMSRIVPYLLLSKCHRFRLGSHIYECALVVVVIA